MTGLQNLPATLLIRGKSLTRTDHIQIKPTSQADEAAGLI
jgi:hypothetical protein